MGMKVVLKKGAGGQYKLGLDRTTNGTNLQLLSLDHGVLYNIKGACPPIHEELP